MSEGAYSGNAAPGKTTVVITAHNYGRYLGQCIESVLAQTHPPARIVVVDDASEDDTADVVCRYLPRIEYHRVEFRNPQRTRNYGLARATTEYVLFLDADDYCAATMIGTLEGVLERHPETRVAYCDKHVIGDAAAMTSLRLTPQWQAPEFSVETLRFRNFIMLTSLIRRRFVTTFDERIRRLQDWDMWLGILHDDSHAIHVPEPLLHYRVHGENISIRQRELMERLKILVKHGLIHARSLVREPGAVSDKVHRRNVVVLTQGATSTELAPWQALARRHGWKVRAIVGVPEKGREASDRESVVRAHHTVLQTTTCPDIEDLFRRYAGVITDTRVDAVIVAADLHSIPRNAPLFGHLQYELRCALREEKLLSAKALEELGTFALSPAAARLLLYLPPAEPLTRAGRLRRAAVELLSRHLGWRFGHLVAAVRHQRS